MILASVLCTFASYYSVGVVQRSQMKYIIDERIDKMAEQIERGYKKEQDIKDKICENYEYRAKMIALIMSQSISSISDENTLEELRIAINADEISITDEKGIIEYSTSYYKGEYAEQIFIENIADRNYTKAIIRKDSDGSDEVIVGTSRADSTGIIQILFTAENVEQTAGVFDISEVAEGYTLLNMGSMGVIDINSYTYLSHTDESFINKAVQIPAEEFDGEKLTFYSYYNSEKAMVRYRIYDDKIIFGIIPLSEIYSLRNAVTAWVAIISIILSIIALLAMRKYIIDEREK
jgi:hypothetical protein